MGTLLLLISFFVPAHAASAPQTIESQYKESWDILYKPLLCGENVYRLINASDVPVSTKANVVHIIHINSPFAQVRPLLPREDRDKKGWSFHAFLVIDGFVYDFDFTQSPTVLPLKAYMAQMWERERFNQEYQIHIKPAHAYTLEDTDGTMASGTYRAINLNEFMDDYGRLVDSRL